MDSLDKSKSSEKRAKELEDILNVRILFLISRHARKFLCVDFCICDPNLGVIPVINIGKFFINNTGYYSLYNLVLNRAPF